MLARAMCVMYYDRLVHGIKRGQWPDVARKQHGNYCTNGNCKLLNDIPYVHTFMPTMRAITMVIYFWWQDEMDISTVHVPT